MDASTITAAGLAVLDEVGLDKLSMRLVAERLGVQVGGLYYHHPDKAALLRSIADALCGEALASVEARGVDDDRPAAEALCIAVRDTLRAHRDAGRVFAAAPMSGSVAALSLMERLIGLVTAGAPGEANAVADTLMAYVTGYVLQEQASRAPGVPYPLTPDEIAERFPLIWRGLGDDDDRTFARAITAILDGFMPTWASR